jgi:hypothetical protein
MMMYKKLQPLCGRTIIETELRVPFHHESCITANSSLLSFHIFNILIYISGFIIPAVILCVFRSSRQCFFKAKGRECLKYVAMNNSSTYEQWMEDISGL